LETPQREYWVYILASLWGTLYVGVTRDLRKRLCEHQSHATAGFTARYDVTRLVHCECFRDINAAIAREKQIKGWSRAKRVALIVETNPGWDDLSEAW
jgi:putative endonuclease